MTFEQFSDASTGANFQHLVIAKQKLGALRRFLIMP